VDLRRRALKDSLRHDKRVKEAIRQESERVNRRGEHHHLRWPEAGENPLRYLDQYRFRFGQMAVGRDRARATLARSSRATVNGVRDEQPGDQPGEQVYEAEISWKS